MRSEPSALRVEALGLRRRPPVAHPPVGVKVPPWSSKPWPISWPITADAERFNAQAEGFTRSTETYLPVPDMHINGQLTMGENIADMAEHAGRPRRVLCFA